MPSGGGLAALFSQTALACVPTPLFTNTIQAALPCAAGQVAAAGMISARVAALTEGVLRAMFLTNLKTVTAVLLVIGLLGTSAGVVTHRALADKPAAANAEEKNASEKPKSEVGPSLSAVVKAVDAGKSTITVTVVVDPAKKQIEEKTFALAKDARVMLHEWRTKPEEGKEGKLADLTRVPSSCFSCRRTRRGSPASPLARRASPAPSRVWTLPAIASRSPRRGAAARRRRRTR